MSGGVISPPGVDPSDVGRDVSGGYAVVEEQRAEALQGLVALSHEGFEEVVGSNGAVADQTLRQVAV